MSILVFGHSGQVALELARLGNELKLPFFF